MKSAGEVSVIVRRAAARVVPDLQRTVDLTMRRALTIARETIGEGRPEWEDFAESTMDRADWMGPLERTGELQASLHIARRPLGGILASGSRYLRYSEYGTSHEPPRPLLEPSIRDAFRQVGIQRLRFTLERVLSD